jgi:hypothetical protein
MFFLGLFGVGRVPNGAIHFVRPRPLFVFRGGVMVDPATVPYIDVGALPRHHPAVFFPAARPPPPSRFRLPSKTLAKRRA